MLPIAHMLAPMVALLLYGRRYGKDISQRSLLAIGLFGLLPDLVNPHISLAARVSWSHSVFILLPIGLLVLLTSDRIRTYSSLLFTGVSIHLILDIISAPYNFLYPLDFSHSIDLYPEFGLTWFISWYAVDIVFLIAFILLMTVYQDS